MLTLLRIKNSLPTAFVATFWDNDLAEGKRRATISPLYGWDCYESLAMQPNSEVKTGN